MTNKHNYFTYTDNTSENNDKIIENLHKQIIDGIDVSGCEFIAKEDEYSSYNRVYKGQCLCSNEEMCKNHPNCFYKKVLKQLKRKEQEYEELKEQYKKLEDEMIKTGANMCGELQKLYRALDEIEKTCLFKIENRQFVLPNVWQHLLDIINIAKDNK